MGEGIWLPSHECLRLALDTNSEGTPTTAQGIKSKRGMSNTFWMGAFFVAALAMDLADYGPLKKDI